MFTRSDDGGVRTLESDAQGGGDGGKAAGGKPDPAHLSAKGPCTFTFPSLLNGICLPQEKQAPLMERPSTGIPRQKTDPALTPVDARRIATTAATDPTTNEARAGIQERK